MSIQNIIQNHFILFYFFKDQNELVLPRSQSYLVSRFLVTQDMSGFGPSRGVGLKSNQPSLGTPTSVCHHCPNIFCMQDKLYIKGFVASLAFTFLFW